MRRRRFCSVPLLLSTLTVFFFLIILAMNHSPEWFQPPIQRDILHLNDPAYTPIALRKRALLYSNTSEMWNFVAEQESRRRHIASICQEKYFGRESTRLHSFILDRPNFLSFCPVYKSASTSWTILLLNMVGISQRENMNLQILHEKIFPRRTAHTEYMLSRNTTRFVVVRHPFERLVSTYRDKFQNGRDVWYYITLGEKMVRRCRIFQRSYSEKEIRRYQTEVREAITKKKKVDLSKNPFAKPLGPTFSEFIKYILSTQRSDGHWRSYEDHCAICRLDYEFILKFENMKSEGSMFLEYLNRGTELHPPWLNRNPGGATNHSISCRFFNQLSVKKIKLLLARYQVDFDLFSYSPEEYLKCAFDYNSIIVVLP